MAQKKKKECLEEDGCLVPVVHLARVARARKEGLNEEKLNRLTQLFKALGNPTRLKIIQALALGEMCVCDLSAYLKLSESAVSHQLARLRVLGLITSRRDSQVLYYSLSATTLNSLIMAGINIVKSS